MIQWATLTDPVEVHDLTALSFEQPCLIFKHSTSCSISAIAKYRLESDWDFPAAELKPFLLDLLAHRNLSRMIAEHFDVYHESPQVLLIKDGICTYDASHLDISVNELHECYESKF
jgi:bacillithiol system protein YtxJ